MENKGIQQCPTCHLKIYYNLKKCPACDTLLDPNIDYQKLAEEALREASKKFPKTKPRRSDKKRSSNDQKLIDRFLNKQEDSGILRLLL